jgi:hypothetical protein
MTYDFICDDCLEKKTGKPTSDLSVKEYNINCVQLMFKVKRKPSDTSDVKCEACGGSNTRKVMGLNTSYVLGYGYMDKSGAKNDMDLHLMTNDADPYGEHRQAGEKQNVIKKLQKNKEFNPKTTSFKMGS